MKKKILLVVATYYKDISLGLIKSAKVKFTKDYLLEIKEVPGAFEIPVVIAKNIKKYDGFLALGCVIKGQTPHFDFISQVTTDAIMKLSINSKKPIGNGVITCLNMKQAKDRKRKGSEAAEAVISVLNKKLYGKIFNDEETISFPKHRFNKFIKDVVLGSIERSELIKDELDTKLGEEFSFKNLDKVFQIILTAATYEFLYKPNISINIIIKEYLNSSNFFLENSQTKYLNALLDNVGKKLRSKDA